MYFDIFVAREQILTAHFLFFPLCRPSEPTHTYSAGGDGAILKEGLGLPPYSVKNREVCERVGDIFLIYKPLVMHHNHPIRTLVFSFSPVLA